MTDTIRLGISACLLGQKVRFDGGHKLDRFLVHTLGPYVSYVPVCPEVESGLPIPRQALRLIGKADNPRLVFSKTKEDYTAAMTRWAEERLAGLAKAGLCGFVFKSKSPSSGLFRVKVYGSKGIPSATGRGLFAALFTRRFPMLPVEEEGRLHDPGLRENFIERIFAHKRWCDLMAGGLTPAKLVEFHTRHKMLLLSHSPKIYRRMGPMVANQGGTSVDQLVREYRDMFLTALAERATPGKHANVMQHMLGHAKKQLDSAEKQEMLELIGQYKLGILPLIVPLTLLKHYVRKHGLDYLAKQYYLDPHPLELKLRNHA